MQVNINAAEKGGFPDYPTTVTITATKTGVEMEVPQTEGVLSNDSAVRLGTALITAGGGLVPAAAAPTLTGAKLVPNGAGYTLLDSHNVVVAVFEPRTQFVAV